MKRFTFFTIAILSLGLISFSSCDKDNNIPSDPPTQDEQQPDNNDSIPDTEPEITLPEDNYMLLGNNVIELKSILVENLGDYIHFFVSPQEGILETSEEILNSGNYLSAIILPSFIGNSIDLMTEISRFTINSTMKELPFESIAPGQTDAIKEGRLLITKEETLFRLNLDMVMADGTEVSVKASTTIEDDEIEINPNTYNFDGEEKPIRASFHGEHEGLMALHFTAGDIDYYDELNKTVAYISIYCTEEEYNGQTINIADYNGKMFITYTNNYTEEVIGLKVSDTGSANDNICITRDPDNEYGFNVYMDVTFPENGQRLVLDFDGVCKDFSPKPAPESELVYIVDGDSIKSAINSLVIDMTDELLCNIYLSAEEDIATVEDMTDNNPLIITFPKEAIAEPFDVIVGFSMYKDGEASISYDGKTYNYGNNTFGTIETSYADGVYSISFDNWRNLMGYYKGLGVIIE